MTHDGFGPNSPLMRRRPGLVKSLLVLLGIAIGLVLRTIAGWLR